MGFRDCPLGSLHGPTAGHVHRPTRGLPRWKDEAPVNCGLGYFSNNEWCWAVSEHLQGGHFIGRYTPVLRCAQTRDVIAIIRPAPFPYKDFARSKSGCRLMLSQQLDQMSKYYNPQRTKNLFDPQSAEPFKLSRSKIDLFLNCPRCFYLDRRQGVGQPPGFPFNLNSAVDALLKNEFDTYRAAKTAHPLMTAYGLDAVPFPHEELDQWRENFHGVQFLHAATNLLLTGAIDDVWVNPAGEIIVVDYKSTSKKEEVSLDADWQIGYKLQMDFYQWLLRCNGFTVSDTGFFVYCNGDTDKAAFDGNLEFDIKLIPYTGNDGWVETAIKDAHACLVADSIPASGEACDLCNYYNARAKLDKAA